jgi:hypothetical protein
LANVQSFKRTTHQKQLEVSDDHLPDSSTGGLREEEDLGCRRKHFLLNNWRSLKAKLHHCSELQYLVLVPHRGSRDDFTNSRRYPHQHEIIHNLSDQVLSEKRTSRICQSRDNAGCNIGGPDDERQFPHQLRPDFELYQPQPVLATFRRHFLPERVSLQCSALLKIPVVISGRTSFFEPFLPESLYLPQLRQFWLLLRRQRTFLQ